MDNSATLTNKDCLITGGLGFIGSNLARRLVELGARVTLVDSLIPEYGGNQFNIAGIEDKVQVNIADVRDEYSMDHLVRGAIFSLTSRADIASRLDAKPVKIWTSTAAPALDPRSLPQKQSASRSSSRARQVYGKPDYLPVDERHLLHPTDVNGINKVAGEWYHILYNNIYGIRAVSLRMTNTYGPRMRVKDARQTFLGIWIKRLIDNEPIEIWGDGKQIRDFNYVDDAVDAILIAATTDDCNGHIFNLGSAERINLGDLAKLCVQVNGAGNYKIIPYPADRKQIDIGDYYADFSLAQKKLGWKPKVALSEGLARTLEFYRKNKEHYW
jgi:UDP-glucose 4-epimerase